MEKCGEEDRTLWEAQCIPEGEEEGEILEEKAVVTLSLSVQAPEGDGKTMGEKGWREQSSMSQLLEKLRRAAEVFADPKAENEESEDESGAKVKEKVVQKVESIFRKPHRAAGKLTLSERKFVEETWFDKNELSNEKVQSEPEEWLEASKVEKKRVRLTIGVIPVEGREHKKKVKKKGEESSNDVGGVQQVSHLRRNVVEIDEGELDLHWDPGAFEMEHMSMEVAPRWNPREGWFTKDVVQPMEAWTEFTPYLASVTTIGPFEQMGGGVRGPCQRSTPATTVVIFAYGGGR